MSSPVTRIRDHAATIPDAVALRDKDMGIWREWTWRSYWEHIELAGHAFLSLGVEPGDRVAIHSENRPEWLVADMGALAVRAASVGIYPTNPAAEVGYLLNDSGSKVMVVEDQEQLDKALAVLDQAPELTRIVYLEPRGIRHRYDHERLLFWDDFLALGREHRDQHPGAVADVLAAQTPDDLATLIYTSGTTGPPKGAMLTVRNVEFAIEVLVEEGAFTDPPPGPDDLTLSYLPLAHVAERILATYGPPFLGSHAHAIPDPTGLLGALGEVHPTAFFGVPRVWEKIKTGISAKLAEDPDPANVKMVQDAMAAGLAWVQAHEFGNEMTPEVQQAYEEADAAILGFLRLLLGLDQVTWAASAAAPMPIEVAKFMGGLGLKVYDVYGMTETTGSFTANGPDGFRLGTVGRANPGIEVKLAEDGEILCRGPVNTPGYYKQEAATRNLIDAEGWIHTGDIGTVDEDGFYSVVDRKKELIITSSGKNIAPSNIENLLKESPLVGHAMAMGDNQPYVVAVLTLDGEIAPLVAQKMGLEFTDLADLASKPEIRAMVKEAVDKANERLSRPEQVKAWELLGEEWTAESEELTPTLKLKRRVVNRKYANVVEGLYGSAE